MPVKSSEAVILIGHGSREAGFEAPMKKIANALSKKNPGKRFFLAYLEITSPSVQERIDECVLRGFSRIKILPYFLLVGRHVKKDLPQMIRLAQKKYGSAARISLAPYLGFHPGIAAAANARLKQARKVK